MIDPDLPLAGSMAEPDDCICAAASSAGIGLLLSGAGGDEGATYNGSGLYAAMLRQGRWRTLPAELHAPPAGEAVAGSSSRRASGLSTVARLVAKGAGAHAPLTDRPAHSRQTPP